MIRARALAIDLGLVLLLAAPTVILIVWLVLR